MTLAGRDVDHGPWGASIMIPREGGGKIVVEHIMLKCIRNLLLFWCSVKYEYTFRGEHTYVYQNYRYNLWREGGGVRADLNTLKIHIPFYYCIWMANVCIFIKLGTKNSWMKLKCKYKAPWQVNIWVEILRWALRPLDLNIWAVELRWALSLWTSSLYGVGLWAVISVYRGNNIHI